MAGTDEQPPKAGGRARAARIARSTASAVLLFLTCVLVPVSVLTVWIHDIALDTDRYVATMAPLARDRAVQDAAVDRIARAVDVRVDGRQVASDVASWLQQHGLPARVGSAVEALGPQLDAAVNQTVTSVAGRFVRSDAFAQVWTNGNRAAHSAVVYALTGHGRGALAVTDGTVTLDVGAAVDQVKAQLVAAGLSPAAKIPSVDRQIVLFQSDQLAKFRSGAHLLDLLGNWLPVITALVGAVGVLLAHRRRRALAAVSWGAAAGCLVIVIALAAARHYYLDHLPAQVQPPAAAAVFDTLLRFLKVSLRMVLVLAVVVALGAYLTGPGRLPRAVRRTADRGADAAAGWGAAHGVRTGPVGRFTAARRRLLTGGVLAVLAVVFAWWDHPTAWVVLLLVLILLAVLLVLALLAASGRTDPPDEPLPDEPLPDEPAGE
ncbi:hypothetical protein GCM10009760_51440 [Kitasatospora kazusensis]|uniref:Aromatic ring-opening dioxygenase LigA n=1 Tax=Kitasatospora kazusensis TaxID=407974 RepID=A0ABN3A515_9ACTN